MLLREAIETAPLDRERNILPRFVIDSEHRDMLEERGMLVLRRAGVPNFFGQLADIILKKGADTVEINLDGRLMSDGTVKLMVRWDPEEQDSFGKTYKAVMAYARPLTRDVIIRGQEAELISPQVWRKNKQAVAVAIADAYRAPALVFWPPAEIG